MVEPRRFHSRYTKLLLGRVYIGQHQLSLINDGSDKWDLRVLSDAEPVFKPRPLKGMKLTPPRHVLANHEGSRE